MEALLPAASSKQSQRELHSSGLNSLCNLFMGPVRHTLNPRWGAVIQVCPMRHEMKVIAMSQGTKESKRKEIT